MNDTAIEMAADSVKAVEWMDGGVRLLDQRLLPQQEHYLTMNTASQVADAITMMVVRGAPAIGIAAAYGVVLAARAAFAVANEGWREAIEGDLARLAATRPTAVNLHWALQRMRNRFANAEADPEPILLSEALAIHREDIAANHRIGALGSQLIAQEAKVLTHCNAGALATGGYGTALGVIRAAYAKGRIARVYADETRPWLQGSRLTAWELIKDGIPVTLIADGAAATLMKRQGLDWVVVGADRIAANGDVANKIGTYGLAVAAQAHGVRFMVAAPVSTVDRATVSGDQIPIEDRSPDEILTAGGVSIAAHGADAWNPVFDVTPAHLIDAIVTERGVVMQPDAEKIAALFSDSQ